MKRKNNLYQQIYSLENLQLADVKARRGKGMRRDIIEHDTNREENIISLQKMLIDKTYRTSRYGTFKIREPKERLVYKLPYFPDRIAQYAAMNIAGPIFTSMLIADTFSCIKGRGIYAAFNAIKKALKDVPGTKYCLKLDIKKFYPNVDHTVLKKLLRRKFKDQDLLWLFDEIIDSADGLPIGNYTSPHLANFYLTGFDHWIKEKKRVKHYYRYADDIVIFSSSKEYLHNLLAEIRTYLDQELQLTIKSNYQIFPVKARGVNIVGYEFWHTHIRLRKTIKKNFAKMLIVRKNAASIASYNGWITHCNGRHLFKKLLQKAG